jgi:translation initiation factor IF-3
LIGADGDNVGVVLVEDARRMAREAGLDLVEVAPNADPPVCRIMDFGKFLYEKTKKEREARKAQTKVEIKEIRLRPKTNVHHRSFKVRDARRWLDNGMKVKVRIRFRGREIDYLDLALKDLKEVAEELSDVAQVEQAPGLEDGFGPEQGQKEIIHSAFSESVGMSDHPRVKETPRNFM